jgi:hypothetical protein
MTRIEANELLDEHKYGIKAYSIVEVTKALWITNDLRGLPKYSRAFSQTGINQWMESTRLASSEGIGQRSDGDMAGNEPRFNQQDESNK